MKSAQDFLNQLQDEGLTTFSMKVDTPEDAKLAKKKIILNQKRLRQIKKEVNEVQKSIRADYAIQSQTAGSGGSTVLSIFGKKKLAGSWRAAAKTDLRAERDSLLQPYTSLKEIINEILYKSDEAKLKCDEIVHSHT
ncbi:hypothetical protein [Ferrimonas pelagia]|uniref:Uncharacterized protein n=1 Tax=Ferrimonas pelagia TaxID=1177826 RepID=A0ABP9EQ18_9GAMM